MINTRITGTQSDSQQELEAQLHERNGRSGVLVYSADLFETDIGVKPFLNPTLGVAMNQAVTFGSVAMTIHNGGTSASADTGTADTNTLNHLIQAGQNFTSTTVVGSSVHNTTDDTYGNATAVLDADITLDGDTFPDGNEAFIIDAVWTGTAVAGTWNFADSGKITLTAGNDSDEASIDADSVARYDWENFTAFTGKIDLDTFTCVRCNVKKQRRTTGFQLQVI